MMFLFPQSEMSGMRVPTIVSTSNYDSMDYMSPVVFAEEKSCCTCSARHSWGHALFERYFKHACHTIHHFDVFHKPHDIIFFSPLSFLLHLVQSLLDALHFPRLGCRKRGSCKRQSFVGECCNGNKRLQARQDHFSTPILILIQSLTHLVPGNDNTDRIMFILSHICQVHTGIVISILKNGGVHIMTYSLSKTNQRY